MKRDNLAQTWQEKFAAFEPDEEYLYQYQIPEQLEKARKAVRSTNQKREMLLELRANRTTFSIRRIAVPDTSEKNSKPLAQSPEIINHNS